MRIQLESQYKAGETLEIDDPHSPGSKIKIQFPHDYDANSWIEIVTNKDGDLPTRPHATGELKEQDVEVGVETVVYTQAQPVYVAHANPVVVHAQPVLVTSSPPPVYVYENKPNVVVIAEEKEGLDERDCCAILLGLCLCSWFFAALSR